MSLTNQLAGSLLPQEALQQAAELEDECYELKSEIEKANAEYQELQLSIEETEDEVRELRSAKKDAVVTKMNGRMTLIIDKSTSFTYQVSIFMNIILSGIVIILGIHSAFNSMGEFYD